MTNTQQAYRPVQIILHWIVVLGILIQWTFNEQIVRVVAAVQSASPSADSDVTMAWVHVGIGSTICLAMLARLFLVLRYGKPDHAPGTPKWQGEIATWMHRALYVTVFAMVITGGLTWNGIAQLGDVHFYVNTALFALAAAHAGAALFNQFLRKDGTLRRMMLKSGK